MDTLALRTKSPYFVCRKRDTRAYCINDRNKKKPHTTPWLYAIASATIVTSGSIIMGDDISSVYTNVSPSVITVTATSPHMDAFAPGKYLEVPNGSGTGFFYVDGEHIVTNAHVIQGSSTVLIDGKPANIVGIDVKHDLAVLQLRDGQKHKPLSKCIKKPHVGQRVLAIGNPFGFEKSMSMGIISGLDRVLDPSASLEGSMKQNLIGLIQTDASINPGNSGGPLLSADTGCVLGMNTAIASSTGTNVGIGFAMPISVIDDMITRDGMLRGDTELDKVRIGITLLPDSYANALGVHGAIIADVVPGGFAEKIGLIGTYRDVIGRPVLGDIILEINGQPVNHGSDVIRVMNRVCTGDLLKVKVSRQTGEAIIEATINGMYD